MKRSELLETAIETEQAVLDYFRNANDKEMCDINQLTLDILLAEQKREEGCPVCRGEVVVKDYFGHRCVKISGHYMEVANAEEEYPWNTVEIKACPFCAKALTDGESE